MNSKMTTNSQQSTTESKNNKNKLSKQLEQEQNHRNGDHLRVISREVEGGRMREKIQGIRRINCRYTIDRRRLRII